MRLMRLRSVFNALLDRSLDGSSWLEPLCAMAACSRPKTSRVPATINRLLLPETPVDAALRNGIVFERLMPPPATFLRWLLNHSDRMRVDNPAHFHAGSETATDWRRKLFSPDPRVVAKAKREALASLTALGAEGSKHAWWAFEGFARIDCCLVTDTFVLFIEAKDTEAVSPSTKWFPHRSQLWRNVEVAHQFARGRDFGVILMVDTDAQGVHMLDASAKRLTDSYPHLSVAERLELAHHLMGFVPWTAVAARFGLPARLLA